LASVSLRLARTMDTTLSIRELLFTLLLKVGVASSIAALLARWNTFRRVLFTEERDADQKLKLMLFMTPPLIVGVTLRLVSPYYRFADLSLEGAFLMGLLGGRVVGPIGGAIITIPALMAHEWLGMPAAATAGLLGGLIRQVIPDKEALWNFGPFTFLNIPKALMRMIRDTEIMWEMLPLLTCVGLELGRVALVEATKPKWLFAIDPQWNWQLALVVIATLMSVASPLKIWNNTRIEMNLERHQQLLLRARMDALSSQINPHFLFNTLNSITSLVRSKPELAREMIVKLANILRILLKNREAFVPFAEELAFTDDYLDIEVVRFGEKLRVVKEIAPDTLQVVVPSMLLQPLIENSIKHGLEPRIDGGTVTLRSRITGDGRLLVEVEDDGVGMAPGRATAGEIKRPGTGIGMRNVRERMQVLYGDSAEVSIESRPGRGTKVALIMPVIDGDGGGWDRVREAVETAVRSFQR
jgi:two-component system LytT family sensor kinase